MTIQEDRDRLLVQHFTELPYKLGNILWYEGRQEFPAVPKKLKTSYRLLMEQSLNPWAQLIVDALAERCTLTGVMTSDGAVAADPEIWKMMRRNHLNVDQRLVHSESLITGVSYMSVWEKEEGMASIVPESTVQVTHSTDASDRRLVTEALKVWASGDKVYCNLYLPDAIHRWESDALDDMEEEVWASPTDRVERYDWTMRDDDVIDNPYGVVPMFPFENRPKLYGGNTSEIGALESVLKRCDKLTLDLLLTAEVGAFRQKWATGLEVPTDPVTKAAVEPFDAAIQKLWVSDDPDVSFGTFEASLLDPYLKAIDQSVAELSAISRVPAYYLVSPNLVVPPAEGTVRASEAGLINKVVGQMGVWGESYEQVVALAQTIETSEELDLSDIEMVWADPELKNDAQLADAATKWSSLGVPNAALWQKAGASPTDIRRWEAMGAQDDLLVALLGGSEEDTEDEPVDDGAVV